jgi:hypothetical protein
MSDGGNAKVREQYLLSSTHEHVLRLDITVDEFLLVRVLQGVSYLLDRRDNHRERDQATFRIAVPQRAMRGIVHDEKRHTLLHIEIEDTDDRGMSQRGDGLGFLLEVLGLNGAQMGMQHLDGCLLVEPHMLPEIDLGIAALSQQGD